MELIVTHINADFDALASLVAAGKLYPGAVLLLPGSPESMVREYLKIYRTRLGIITEKRCRLKDVRRLIIVDTSQASRIGKAAALIGQRGLKIEIYDHHPPTPADIKADKSYSKKIGAATTILVEQIKKKRINLSPREATLMVLGIYEDTGALTLGGTDKADVDAVSYLLSCGANLNEVSFYLHKELTSEEISLLTKLIHQTQAHEINGVRLAIATCQIDDYTGELAVLTHRLLDIENFNVLFVLASFGDRVQVIARSRLDNVDVGRILSRLGGGGHPTAASGVIKNTDLNKAYQNLLKVLSAEIRPVLYAGDIVARLGKTVLVNDTVDKVKKIMVRFGLSCVPVLENQKLVGLVTRTDLDKAIHHGFGSREVAKYMSTDFVAVNPSTPFTRLRDIIFGKDISLLPVVEQKKLVGVISRAEVLRHCQQISDMIPRRIDGQDTFQIFPEKNKELVIAEGVPLVKNLKSKLQMFLPRPIFSILKTIGEQADKRKMGAFVVGGFVRDLLLEVENYDVDITVEGDAVDFAQQLAKLFGARVITHKKFGTAVLILKDGFKIDFTSARTEYYEYPAALPIVEYSSIKHDLFRRDFTINSMAIKINRRDFGQLIDFFRGQHDLRAGRIKVLHNLSFVEDPTRIFRAVRFEQRYGFVIDQHTEYLIKTAVNLEMFDRVESQRLREEIVLILSEKQPLKAIIRMNQLHELRFIHPNLKLNKRMIECLSSLEDIMVWFRVMFPEERINTWLVYFMLLCSSLVPDEIEQVGERFCFSGRDRRIILEARLELPKVLRFLSRSARLKPSRIYQLLSRFSQEGLLLGLAKTKSRLSRKMIFDYLTLYRQVRLRITGEDLKKMGLKPGPDFKKILEKVLLEKMDGKVHTRKEELELARKVAIR